MVKPELFTADMELEECAAVLQQLVRDHDFEELLSELKTLPTERTRKVGWEIYPLVMQESDELRHKKEDSPEKDEFNKLIKKIVAMLNDSSTPKESLMMNMESLPNMLTSYGFDLVLENVGECLKRRQEYSKPSLIWALDVIADCLEKLPPPQEINDEDADERELMHVDHEARAIECRYVSLLNFLDNQLTLLNEKDRNFLIEKDRSKICSHLMRPLGTTLGLLDLSPAVKGKPENPLHSIAVRLSRIVDVIRDPFIVLGLADGERLKFLEDDFGEGSRSAGVLAYMVVCSGKSFPRVYSPDTLSGIMLMSSLKLLLSQRTSHVLKGVDLLEEALVYVNCVRRDDNIEIVSTRLLEALSNVMTSFPVHEARKRALRLWNELFKKCHPDIRLELLFLLFQTCEHPSIRGFIVDRWRRLLSNTKPVNGSEIFQKLIFLPEGGTNELLHHSEYLLASLNMLRHLLLFHMIEKLPELETYLTDFKKALQSSRAQCERQLNGDEEVKLESLIPNVPKHMEKEVLEHALIRFDLMESILGIVQSYYDSL